jgi:hypothetical protein
MKFSHWQKNSKVSGVLPDKFVAGCIIAKLPPTWTDFATSLKHKRKEFSIADLIGSLDVEEKARAKDTHEKGVVGTSSANVVQKNNSNKSHKKKKNKQENPTKTKQTTNFKKKNKGNCFVCGDPGHFTSECENRKWKGNKKSANMIIGEITETSRYGNILPTVLLKSHKKKKNKQENPTKTKQITNFKKKNKGNCFVCGDPGHFTSECENRKWKGNKKSANMIIGEITETSRYGNILPTVLSVCHSPEWWIDTGANIHVCVDISLFSSYQAGGAGSLLMGNRSHARVLGVDTVNLKLTSGKTM